MKQFPVILLTTLLSGFLFTASSFAQTKEQIAKDFLLNKAPELRLTAEDIAGMELVSETRSKKSGLTHVYLQQQYQGIKVHNAILNVHITRSDEVLTYSSRALPDLKSKIQGTDPVLTPQKAVEAAALALGYSFRGHLLVKEQPEGPSKEVLFEKGDLSEEDIPVKLVYQPVGNGTARLAWEVTIYEPGWQNWWVARVDAGTGKLLDKHNLVISCNFGTHDAAGCTHEAGEKHFAVPPVPENPVMAGAYNVFPAPIESPSHGSRSLVANPEDPMASPYGWHDTNGAAGAEYTITRGNNVYAQLDDDNNNNTFGFAPDGGPSLVFDFPLNLALPPGGYQSAAITNLFFWNNYMHDFSYRYGFDEASGNFQQNNYGKGGAGNDYVIADAQDAGGTNNANFSTPADGSRPRMQMYIWTAANPDRDSDLDNGVIAHEYAHGISNRLTGGPANSGCLSNTEQMGEGWSDFYALMTTLESGDQGTDSRGIGTYVTGQPVNGGGIRPTPYSTSMAINPATYNTIKTVSVPHGVGYVWCGMIWDLNWAMIGKHGNTSGFNMTMDLVTEGLKLQPCSPGFVDGRNAILAADMALNSGANQCLIWEVFARRGLGYSASQGSTASRTDGVEAFDLPPSCRLEITPSFLSVCQPNNAVYNLTVGANGLVTLSATGVPAGATLSFSPNPVASPGNSTMTIGNTGAVAPGVYNITVTATGTITHTAFAKLIVQNSLPAQPVLAFPVNGASGVTTVPTLTWNSVPNADSYTVQVATDIAFSNMIANANVIANTFTTPALNATTAYYWRVLSVNACGMSGYSAVFSFTTATIVCNTYTSTNVPVTISATGTPTINSVLNIPSTGTIIDVNVQNLNITHSWIDDLIIDLKSPGGTPVRLMEQPCDDENNILINFDDEAASPNFPCPPTNNGTYKPFQPLSAFDGLPLSGVWTLTVMDVVISDGGSLNAWSLKVCYNPPASDVFNINDVTVAEGNGSGNTALTFTVSRTGTGSAASVVFATANGSATTAGNDYLANSGTLNFAVGEAVKSVTIQVQKDDVVELDENFFVNLTNSVNAIIGDGQGQGLIQNDDSATLSINSVSGTEGAQGATTSLNFTVTLNNAVDVPLTVDYQSADGTATTADNDYVAAAAFLSFTGNAGEAKIISITVNGDNACEPDETLTVALGNIQAAGRNVTTGTSPGSGTILNDDNFEICDGLDNDCDGLIDEGLLTTYYQDSDGDGYGNPAVYLEACTPPAGYVTSSTDCNDNNGAVHPAATEICNSIDDDCDGQIDEGTTLTFYADNDGDGYGNPAVSQQACSAPAGYVLNNTDCNDSNGAVHPGATEICNGIDDNCNGQVDEGGLLTFYRDADNDGYGNPAISQQACSAPAGYVSNNTDCNDGNSAVHPGATEVCNGIDDNCNGQIDEGVTTTFYADNDGDGYGNPASSIQACSAPAGYVLNNTDCNDNSGAVHPGATEACNGFDDNCNGQIDEGAIGPVWYADADGDGYGNPAISQQACIKPAGYVSNNTDCNDGNGAVHPGATEVCNGIDDNCNGQIDEGGLLTFYRDADNDGYGNPAISQQACIAPAGYVFNNTDCNDSNGSVHPGATEVCNGIDDNCNSQIDEGVLLTFFRDADNDGFGNPGITQQACSIPAGYVANNSDCNDNNSAIHPGAAEVCNGIDDNCNGQIDEGVLLTFFQDADGDGYGNPAVLFQACSLPAGYSVNGLDCNDNNAAIHPGAIEICNGIDDDCNGLIDDNCTPPCTVTSITVSNISPCNDQGTADPLDDTFTADVTVTYINPPAAGTLNLSGSGSASVAVSNLGGPASHTFAGLTMTANGTIMAFTASFSADPNCTWTNINAGFAPANCSGNCFIIINGVVVTPESCPGTGDGAMTIDATGSGQLGYSINGGATFTLINTFTNLTPGTYSIVVQVFGTPTCIATTTATVGTNGAGQTWYKDMDNDNYSDGVTIVSCFQPAGFKLAASLIATSGDCNDNDPLQFPGQTWYKDSDNDGYSNGATLVQCSRPAGYKTASELTATAGDCNDNNAAVNPAAAEVCNGIDDNCNGQIDEGVPTGLTYVGNVTFTTQAEVNAWYACYSIIEGNLTIQYSGINNLAPLANLVQVTGNVTIQNTSLPNLNGLNSLTAIGGTLKIMLNSPLTALTGLGNLASVGGALQVFRNFNLTACCAIYTLINAPGAVAGVVSIYLNKTTCDSVAAINAACSGGGSIIIPIGSGQSVVNTQATEVQQVEVFPNPVLEEVNILIARAFYSGTVRLFDLQGRLILSQDLDANTMQYQLRPGHLIPGAYMLLVVVDGENFTEKLIVE